MRKYARLLTHLTLLIAIAYTGPAFAATEGQQDILNIMRCTNQWDFTIYAHASRAQGKGARETTKRMIASWVHANDKPEFKAVITDAIRDAVKHVYAEKQPARNMSGILDSANRGFVSCLRKYKLQKYSKHLAVASSRAGLVTLWDHYRAAGIKKQQVIAKAKNPLSARSMKMLDDVYSKGFNLQKYRITHIWNPTIDAISNRFHGVKTR